MRSAAEQPANDLDQDLLALKNYLKMNNRGKNLYAVLFGYILHSYSMEQFAEEIYQIPQLSAEHPFWNGYSWAIYPIKTFNTGVTFLPVDDYKFFTVSAATVPRVDFQQLLALAKDAAADQKVDDQELIKAFKKFNIFDEKGKLTIPVFADEWPERLEGMAKKVYVKTAELAESGEMTKLLGMETSAQAEMFLHYELRYAFLAHLLKKGTMPAPFDFENADNNSPADVGSLLFLITPKNN